MVVVWAGFWSALAVRGADGVGVRPWKKKKRERESGVEDGVQAVDLDFDGQD